MTTITVLQRGHILPSTKIIKKLGKGVVNESGLRYAIVDPIMEMLCFLEPTGMCQYL